MGTGNTEQTTSRAVVLMDKITKWLIKECALVYSDVGHYMQYREYRDMRQTVFAPTGVHWERQEVIHKENKR